jgi:predicted nucleotidyltransferase
MFKEEWIIYEVLSGSHAYGLNTPESDEDYRGIMLPPIEYYFSPFKEIYQYIEKKPSDRTIFSLDKFIKLSSQNNPNILELLFIDEKHVKIMTPIAKLLRKNRDLFLSAKCKFTYSGYAYSQISRVKKHKKWIDNPPGNISRKDMGLPENEKIFSNTMLQSLMDDFRNHLVGKMTEALCDIYNKFDKDKTYKAVSSSVYEIPIEYFKKFSLNYFVHQSKDIVREDLKETMEREIDYFVKKREWKQYCKWKENRNPKRAELEKIFGYDVKHCVHLARLLF